MPDTANPAMDCSGIPPVLLTESGSEISLFGHDQDVVTGYKRREEEYQDPR